MKEKAVFYARVSTVNKEQDSSIENQVKMCEKFLLEHSEIQLAEPIDSYCEKISGKSDNRPKYRKMLDRIEQGDIKYIIIKDTKRISRASDVSAQLRNTLKRHNMKLIILSEGGRIKDINADENRMIYGFEALMAEELVFTQSRYGRLAHQQKCAEKRLNRNNICFGYRWNEAKATIEIDNEQAQIVKQVFEQHTISGKDISDIQLYLNTMGYEYSKVTIRKWLRKEAYIGVFYLNQKGSELGVGIGGKTKRFTNPKEEWVRVDRPDLRIIDDDLFYLTQKMMSNKAKLYSQASNGIKQGRFTGQAIFAGKIFCSECGKSYVHKYADRNKSIDIYVDSFKSKTRNFMTCCGNEYSRLYEEDLLEIYSIIRSRIISENRDSLSKLKDIIHTVIRNKEANDVQLMNIDREIKKLQKKADDLTMSYVSAPPNMKERIKKLYDDCESKIEELNMYQEKLSVISKKDDSIITRINSIDKIFKKYDKQLDDYIDSDTINRKEIRQIIDKVIVCGDGGIKVYMNSDSIISDSCVEYKIMDFSVDFTSRQLNLKSKYNKYRKYKIEVYITL